MQNRMGADIISSARALALRKGIRKLTGAEPEIDLQADHVRIYFAPDELRVAQAWFKKNMNKEPGKIRMEVGPVVTPYFIKRLVPYAIGALALAYYLGKE